MVSITRAANVTAASFVHTPATVTSRLGPTRTATDGSAALIGRDCPIEPLTRKEQEVLDLLAELLTTEEIATTMFISVNTVRTHVRNILRKLDVSRRNEAVLRARASHLI